MTTAEGLNANSIVSLHELSDGVMAIGTADGLVTLDRPVRTCS